MSKKGTKWILPAEQEGWELWEMQKGRATMVRALEGKYAKQALASVVLPVRAVSSEIIEVLTADPDTEKAMAIVELESSVLDLEETTSVDAFYVSRNASEALYTGLVIDPSSLATEPAWVDSVFDWSPRCYAIDDGIFIWREHGRWAYACYQSGKPIFADLLGSGELPQQLSGVLSVVKPRMMMLGIDFDPKQAIVADSSVRVDACEQSLGIPVIIGQRELLISPPEVALNYAPPFVATLRKQRKQANTRCLLIMLGLLFVAALVIFTGYQRRDLQKQIDAKQQIVDSKAALVADNQKHDFKWDELEPVVNEAWPLNLYEEVAASITRKQDVSLKSVVISKGQIEIKGLTRTYSQAKKYRENIGKRRFLKEFKWSGKADPQNGKVPFHYKGEMREELN